MFCDESSSDSNMKPSGDLLQRSAHANITVVSKCWSPENIIWRHCDVIWWFITMQRSWWLSRVSNETNEMTISWLMNDLNQDVASLFKVETLTLVTLYDVTLTDYVVEIMSTCYTWCLYHFLWILIVNFVVQKLAFCVC